MKLFKTAGILGLISLGLLIIGVIGLLGAIGGGFISLLSGGNLSAFIGALMSAGFAAVIIFLAMLAGIAGFIFQLIGYFHLGKKHELFVPVAWLMIVSLVPFLGIISALALIVVTGIAFIKLSEATNDKTYLTYAISIFAGILIIPIIFTMVMQYIVLFRLDKELQENK